MGASRQVMVGGQARTIEKFSGRKVAVALKVIERLAQTYEGVQDVVTDFRRDYGERRPIRLGRGEVAMRVAELSATIGQARTVEMDEESRAQTIAALTETMDSYQQLLDGPLKDEEYVQRPGVPSSDEVFLHVVSKGFTEAEEQFIQVLGLALMSNHDVGEARKAGNIDERMTQVGDDAMDTADLDELLLVAQAAAEMLLGDLAERRKVVGKIGALFRPASTEESSKPSTTTEDSTLTSGRPTGLTDSPPPTDGEPTTPLTQSLSASASGS